MRWVRLLSVAALLGLNPPPALAGASGHTFITVSAACGATSRVMVVAGRLLPEVLGASVDDISLWRWSGTALEPIVFQIDRKDAENRYILAAPEAVTPAAESNLFAANDELALLFQDTGALRRPAGLGTHNGQDRLLEVELRDRSSGPSRWLYIKRGAVARTFPGHRYIQYLPAQDSVVSENFAIGFSAGAPFLVDSLVWRAGPQGGWSPDVVDTMKIRHTGKLFGFIPFERDADDYRSRLIAVKQGPIRIIRRTKNRLRMVWRLSAPTVLVDYVVSPDGFVMDTVIDIPFPVGLFFSDIVTLTTVDWNSAPNLPVLHISTDSRGAQLLVDGRQTREEAAFNTLTSASLVVDSRLGQVRASLDIPNDFPIQSHLYLLDDLSQPDRPEQDPGQFGNVGFKTTGWENIDTEVRHMEFRACLISK